MVLRRGWFLIEKNQRIHLASCLNINELFTSSLSKINWAPAEYNTTAEIVEIPQGCSNKILSGRDPSSDSCKSQTTLQGGFKRKRRKLLSSYCHSFWFCKMITENPILLADA